MALRHQQGFAVTEAILILVVAAIVGFTGWYVWHARQNANDSLSRANTSTAGVIRSAKLSGPCHLTSPTMNGKILTSADGKYSFCVPDGWELNGGGSLATNDWVSAQNPDYRAGVTPLVLPGAGSDGIRPLFITEASSGQKVSGTVNKFRMVGPIKSTNAVGVEYGGTQTVIPKFDGLGSADKGAVEHLYALSKNGVAVSFDYFVLPGNVDNAAVVKAAAESTTIN